MSVARSVGAEKRSEQEKGARREGNWFFRRGKNFNAFLSSRLLTQHPLERRRRLLALRTEANWARTVAAETKVRARRAGQGRRGTRRAPRPGHQVLTVVEFVEFVAAADDAVVVRATTPATPAAATMLREESCVVLSLCD